MKSASKGFTLIEIIVVMLIISIAGSMVFMNLGKGADKREIKAFVEKMVSVCKQAGVTALASDAPVSFVISPMDRQCWISVETPELESKKAKKSVFAIPGEILIEAKGLTETKNGFYEIIFYPDGSSSGGDIAIRKGDTFAFFCRIDLLTGIVSVTQEDKGGWK